MINPQENPDLLTQDYFQELLEKIYPGMKVNDIIPFHHQGLASAMINNRSIYYGYWTFPCRSYYLEMSKIHVAGSPAKIVLGPFPNDGTNQGTAFDYTWFGLASYVEHSSTFNPYGITFSGFRATFDNTPAPAPAPTPEPVPTVYQYGNQPLGVVQGGNISFKFQVLGVPNSTVHMNVDGSLYAGNNVGFFSVMYDGGSLILSSIPLSQFSTTPYRLYDVLLDSSGQANLEIRFGPFPGAVFNSIYGNITGATAGTPGFDLQSIEYANS